jgi:hypothetical protein
VNRASLVAAILITSSATGFAAHHPSDAEMVETFRCPESLTDNSARLAALQQFLAWVRDHHSDWTIAKTTGYRLYLLEKHHCDRTLSQLRSHDRAAW